MTKFDISKNGLWEAGTKTIAEALKGNSIMTELNIADNLMGKGGAVDIAKTIPTMGALASLDLSQNSISESESSRIKAVCEVKSISLKV